MSSNPFRRSSLRDPKSTPSPSPSRPIPGHDGVRDVPFKIDLRGVNHPIEKHVNFASPPAIPISPISYPSSPESNRMSPELFASKPLVGTPAITDGRALHSDPFTSVEVNEDDEDDDDGAIIQAVENAKANAEIVRAASGSSTPGRESAAALPPPPVPPKDETPPKPKTKEEAVRDTLSRFSSGPKRPTVVGRSPTDSGQSAKSAMDVNAFTKMLLGGSGPPSAGAANSPAAAAVMPHSSGYNSVHNGSSGTDPGSMSQRSVSESLSSASDSSESSSEPENGRNRKTSASNTVTTETRRKPPPIPTIHRDQMPSDSPGKPPPTSFPADDAEETNGINIRPAILHRGSSTQDDQSDRDSVQTTPHTTPSSEIKRRPPPPPMSRRKSHRVPSSTADTQSAPPPAINIASSDTSTPPPPTTRTAPPPPLRRSSTNSDRRASTASQEIAPISEESEASFTAPTTKTSSKSTSSSLRPPPPPSRTVSGSIRTISGTGSYGTALPPPAPPPPRRLRATSKVSLDENHDGSELSQRLEERKAVDAPGGLSPSAAKDILADLAALQREVDALRRGSG